MSALIPPQLCSSRDRRTSVTLFKFSQRPPYKKRRALAPFRGVHALMRTCRALKTAGTGIFSPQKLVYFLNC